MAPLLHDGHPVQCAVGRQGRAKSMSGGVEFSTPHIYAFKILKSQTGSKQKCAFRTRISIKVRSEPGRNQLGLSPNQVETIRFIQGFPQESDSTQFDSNFDPGRIYHFVQGFMLKNDTQCIKLKSNQIETVHF